MSTEPNREQGRAAWAYEAVSGAHADRATWSRYQGVVMGLPVVILRCGLVGALAWLHRQNDAGKEVRRQLGTAKVPGLVGGPEELLPRACALPLGPYMVATREVLKLAGWLKRAAQGMGEGADERGTEASDHA